MTWAQLPFKKAIQLFLARKLMTRARFDKLSDAYKARSFTVGEGYRLLAIEQTRDEIAQALQEGSTIATFRKQLQAFFDAKGLTRDSPHHLFTVFQTNVLGAYQHGRYFQQRSPAVIKARPFWQYRTVGDGRVREAHRAMDGEIYPADSPVWDSWYPPNGFNCRCRVEAISRDEADQIGVSEQAPDVRPDKGFAASPAAWLKT